MLSRLLPRPLIGILTILLMLLSLFIASGLMIPAMLLKLLPIFALQRLCSRYCVACARLWVRMNQLVYRALHPLPAASCYGRLQIDGVLLPGRSYLLIANHQSWADILILCSSFSGRLPFLRFFLKKDLLYVPIIGLVCWAMDFPFMTRKSGTADIAATRRACEVYKLAPVTVANFLEGTRFSPSKQAAKANSYAHLLRPKSAGLSYTFNAMGEQFSGLIDVTICYQPTSQKLVWSWLCGDQAQLQVQVRIEPLPATLLQGDYSNDAAFRSEFQSWVNALWARKDTALAQLKLEA